MPDHSAQPGAPLAICLMGPTASGKTDLAVALTEHLPCDIISVDSALIYRGMDIGTAKPDAETLARAPHRLIDIRWPEEIYSAADFRADALREMQAISAHGRIPLLVGGTMMYFKALLHGMGELPAADSILRKRLEAEADARGWGALHAELAAADPLAARLIHPNNRQRLLRALEIWHLSGKVPSSFWRADGDEAEDSTRWQQDAPTALPYNVVQLAINPADRAVLHGRIHKRFLAMLDAGFIDEVQALRQRPGMHPELPSVRCVGYRQVWNYLDGAIDRAQMIDQGVAATRQLAKRQLTWLRSWPGLHRLNVEDEDCVGSALKILARHATLEQHQQD